MILTDNFCARRVLQASPLGRRELNWCVIFYIVKGIIQE